MKKIILAILIITLYANSWETITHRAIDKSVMKHTSNLTSFVAAVQLSDENYAHGKFEGYKDKEIGGEITYVCISFG